MSWWCHQMEIFSALLAICAKNSAVTGEFPTQRPVERSFGVFFDLRLKRLSKQSDASDLRRHCGHYAIIVMWVKRQELVPYDVVKYMRSMVIYQYYAFCTLSSLYLQMFLWTALIPMNLTKSLKTWDRTPPRNFVALWVLIRKIQH